MLIGPYGSMPVGSEDDSAAAKPRPPSNSGQSGGGGLWGWVKSTAGHVASTVSTVARDGVHDVEGGVDTVVNAQRNMDAANSKIGGTIDSWVSGAEHTTDNVRAWLRQHGGAAGQVASDAIGFNEGAALSLYGMGKGVVQMADDAMDLDNPVEWMADPQANIDRIKSTVNSGVALGKIAELGDPASWVTNPGGNAKLTSALWNTGVRDFRSDPSEFLGNATATVATLFIPGAGEAGAAADAAKVADTAADITPVVETAEDASKAASLTTQDTTAEAASQLQTGARQVIRNPNTGEAFDRAEIYYDTIRADTTDVSAIADNTGIPSADIQQIKEHLFFKDHLLDSGPRRFDADPQIANAWSRLATGDFVPSDLDLLNHELFESNYEMAHGVDYRTAHTATLQAGYPWNPGPGE